MSEQTTQLLQSLFDGDISIQELSDKLQGDTQAQADNEQSAVADLLNRYNNTLTLFKERTKADIKNPLEDKTNLQNNSEDNVAIDNDITAIASTLGFAKSSVKPHFSFANNTIIVGAIEGDDTNGKNYFAYHDGNIFSITQTNFVSLYNLLAFIIERASRTASVDYLSQLVSSNVLINLYVGDNPTASKCQEFYKVLSTTKGELGNHFEATIQQVAFVDGAEILLNKPRYAALCCNNIYDLIFSLPSNGNGVILLTVIVND